MTTRYRTLIPAPISERCRELDDGELFYAHRRWERREGAYRVVALGSPKLGDGANPRATALLRFLTPGGSDDVVYGGAILSVPSDYMADAIQLVAEIESAASGETPPPEPGTRVIRFNVLQSGVTGEMRTVDHVAIKVGALWSTTLSPRLMPWSELVRQIYIGYVKMVDVVD